MVRKSQQKNQVSKEFQKLRKHCSAIEAKDPDAVHKLWHEAIRPALNRIVEPGHPDYSRLESVLLRILVTRSVENLRGAAC